MADVKHARANPKKRKSFLKKQKQYGKKGKFGRGVELTEESYQYFIRILEVINSLKNKEHTDDMKILANNAIEEIKGKEVDTCSNQLSSRVIEQLLPFTSNEKLIALSKTFGSELRLVFTDSFCSHVLQQLIVTLTQRIVVSDFPSDDETKEEITACLTQIAKFALNNVEDFVFDTYANRCLRTIFSCVNGRPLKEDTGKGDTLEKVPAELNDLAESFVSKIVKWPQFNDLTTQTLPSACLQSLLIATRHSPKHLKKLVKRVFEACEMQTNLNFDDENLKPLVCLMEASITVSPPKYFLKFYERFFKNQLAVLALSKNNNFLVQKLILHCTVKEVFEEIFTEVAVSFDSLLNAGHFSGVLYAMAKSCSRFKTKQGDYSKNLMQSLHCDVSDDSRMLTSVLICCLTTFEKYDPGTTKINLHGSLILQEMLNFTKPIKLVASLLSIDVKTLVTVLSDPRGCHVTDAYCSSQFVGEKNREKLYRKLQKNYGELAASKHGSRSFDAIWATLEGKQKIIVMEELKSAQSSLVATPCGLIIASKVQLDLFRKDKEAWISSHCQKKTALRKSKTEQNYSTGK